jgi:hypothetical protein
MKRLAIPAVLFAACLLNNLLFAQDQKNTWSISAIPASVRIDPTTNKIIEDRFIIHSLPAESILEKNWIFDGVKVKLFAAKGEYISFQVVLSNHSADALKGIDIDMSSFKNISTGVNVNPELFLEWSVEVKTPSTGYPKASLGKGWYPDALIPIKYIQKGAVSPKGGWIYPLQLPDFNNRIDKQLSQIFWIDQYIPLDAGAGIYTAEVKVTIGSESRKIPVELNIWNFTVPNENNVKASLQHEGFVSSMNEKDELAIYQLMKRNRVAVMDPTYGPLLNVSASGAIGVDWKSFDGRFKKYLSGDAFTKAFGYENGPGYAEPVETFLLPFDIYGKHDTPGWPDIGKPDVELQDSNQAIYISVIHEVRDHLKPLVNENKTDLTVYLNGLDESYFPEAWQRMRHYGNLFKKEYPGTRFRVDGAYNDSAMDIIENSISSWAVHTIEFDQQRMNKYNKFGINQWIYGPLLYESKINSWVGSCTFIDLPLINDRALSWSVWKYHAHSWISWGIAAGWKAAWYDPESWKSANDGGNAGYDMKKMNGNALLIYAPGIVPNVDGPCPSIRLKTMRDGIQEYEYLKLLAAIDKSDKNTNNIVNTLIKNPFGEQSVGNMDVWSYDVRKWDSTRIRLGEQINSRTNTNIVYPKESTETLINPGRGFATTGRTYNENLSKRMHPKSGVIQQRWYWDEIEPEEGKIDFKLIDSVIAKAQRNGQQLNFRIMTQNEGMRIPAWAIKQGVASPYYDNEVFLKKQEQLIRALAKKYDGHPGVCFIDIGTVGHWGEWHTEESNPAEIRMPTVENTHRIIDFYIDNFKKTPLVMLIGWKEGLEYAVSKGAGWRADCWGDMDTTKWNHMGGRYPKALKIPGVTEAWKRAPVALETCWTFEKWFEEKWDIDYILGKALDWHASEVNNGSEAIPAEWWNKTIEFEKKLGYRLVLKKISYPLKAPASKTIDYSMEWENKGVAPVYQQYQLIIRLTAGNKKYTMATAEDPRKWFPGTSVTSSSVKLPVNIPAGKYIVEVGLVKPGTLMAAVNLANEGKTDDGWYQAGEMEIIKK